MLEIIEGMLYLHEQGLVHKDLKPENILVDADFHIKVCVRKQVENADDLGVKNPVCLLLLSIPGWWTKSSAVQ